MQRSRRGSGRNPATWDPMPAPMMTFVMAGNPDHVTMIVVVPVMATDNHNDGGIGGLGAGSDEGGGDEKGEDDFLHDLRGRNCLVPS